MKYLIISHNTFNEENNVGKSLISLFGKENKNQLIQLYVNPIVGDNPDCFVSDSFLISDRQTLKNFLLFRSSHNEPRNSFEKEETNYLDESKSPDKLRVNQDSSSFRHKLVQGKLGNLAKKGRDFIWDKSKWFSKDLSDWIELHKPDAIIFFPGEYSFIYNISNTISQTYEIPVFTYYFDDYYFLNSSISKKIEKNIATSLKSFFISDSMMNYYRSLFGDNHDFSVIRTETKNLGMTMLNLADINPQNITLSYIGNCYLGREEVLSNLCKAINLFNKTHQEFKVNFEIFSPLSSIKNKNSFIIDNCNYYSGTLDQEGVKMKIFETDFLVHVESFEQSNIEKTKHSWSTKLAEYMISRRPVIMVSPEGINSTDYLDKNNAAIICKNNDVTKIVEFLYDIVIHTENDPSQIQQIVDNAFDLAVKNHTNQRSLMEQIKEKMGE